jgi:heme/copper-type cytochrome/quinol oxidase subunit 2
VGIRRASLPRNSLMLMRWLMLMLMLMLVFVFVFVFVLVLVIVRWLCSKYRPQTLPKELSGFRSAGVLAR